MDGVKRLITFFILIAILPSILIMIPLYLRHFFYADVAYAVTESDIIEINDGISTIFCSEHTLKMNGTFNAFQMAHRPEITSKRTHIRLKKSMNLPDDTLEYWGFYLLKNATVALSVCSRFEGASILVVKGERNLRTCGLLEHNKQTQEIFLPSANRQVKITYESDAQEIDSKETTIESIKSTSNINEIDKPAINVSSENLLEGNFETNRDDSTQVYTTDEKLTKSLENLYETAASYIYEHIGDQQKSVNNIRKERHIKRYGRKKNKYEEIKQIKKYIYDYDKNMRLQKLEQILLSYMINGRKEQETKEKDEIDTKRFKRSRELVKPSSLLDQGIKHGGNADKSMSNSEGTSSVSSFESNLLNCYNGTILLSHEFHPSDECTNISYLLNKKHTQATHHVEQDGYYYYIFYSDNDIVSNDIYAIFDIYKPTFQYENVTKSCINQTECSFRISLLSADRIIVEIPTKDGIEHNEMDDVGMLISVCQPRMGIYMIFPIAILIVILGCAYAL